jgi:hypothetical protein
MSERKGDWIQTASGVQFWPLDPRPEEIKLEDIAHALSNLCRFGGHCRTYYSVAQHSVYAAENVAQQFKVQALLHDATEAYLIDVPRPIKRSLTNYHDIEAKLARVVSERFGVDLVNLPQEVKEADERMLMTEKRDITLPAPAPWTVAQGVSGEPYSFIIRPWDPVIAKKLFLTSADVLGIR